MTARQKKYGCVMAVLLLAVVVGIPALWWAWKYYQLPELPDRRNYKTIEQRADCALAFANRHNMNEHYVLFVDYTIPSGKLRLFVWDFHIQRIVASTYVMYGPGGGSTDKKPRFSNRPGSNCSSLGRFLVTKDRGTILKRSFRLKGMDFDNQTAYARGLMIHSSKWVDSHCWMDYIPLHSPSCQGCVTISSRGMSYLWELINNEKKHCYYGVLRVKRLLLFLLIVNIHYMVILSMSLMDGAIKCC